MTATQGLPPLMPVPATQPGLLSTPEKMAELKKWNEAFDLANDGQVSKLSREVMTSFNKLNQIVKAAGLKVFLLYSTIPVVSLVSNRFDQPNQLIDTSVGALQLLRAATFLFLGYRIYIQTKNQKKKIVENVNNFFNQSIQNVAGLLKKCDKSEKQAIYETFKKTLSKNLEALKARKIDPLEIQNLRIQAETNFLFKCIS